MKANKFVKKFGWDKAQRWVLAKNDYDTYKTRDMLKFMEDLKLLVESFKLVECYGGLIKAKVYASSGYRNLSSPETTERLKQAIIDVERCNE